MTLGILAGVFFRKRRKLVLIFNRSTIWIIFLLLFFMGVSVGNNQDIMNNLSTIGIQGISLSMVAILGSVLVSWLVYVLFFKKQSNEG